MMSSQGRAPVPLLQEHREAHTRTENREPRTENASRITHASDDFPSCFIIIHLRNFVREFVSVSVSVVKFKKTITIMNLHHEAMTNDCSVTSITSSSSSSSDLTSAADADDDASHPGISNCPRKIQHVAARQQQQPQPQPQPDRILATNNSTQVLVVSPPSPQSPSSPSTNKAVLLVRKYNFQYNFIGRDFAPIHTQDISNKVIKLAEQRLEQRGAPCHIASCGSRDADNDNDNTPIIPAICTIKHSQIELGTRLGEGSFHTVYQIKSLRGGGRQLLLRTKSSSLPTITPTSQSQSPSPPPPPPPPPPPLVVKVLRRKLLDKHPMVLAKAAADLVQEGRWLNLLAGHPNIVQIHGWTETGLQGFSNGRHDAFCLVLEQLQPQSLRHKLQDEWPRRQQQLLRPSSPARSFLLALWGPSKQRQQQQQRLLSFLQERLVHISDLLSALVHLQAHSILHRDIKPENIGFDLATVSL
jgi:hypothetical protein